MLLNFFTSQSDPDLARDYLLKVAQVMDKHWPEAAKIVKSAQDEVLTYKQFP